MRSLYLNTGGGSGDGAPWRRESDRETARETKTKEEEERERGREGVGFL